MNDISTYQILKWINLNIVKRAYNNIEDSF